MASHSNQRAVSQFQHNGLGKDKWSSDTEATATCYCGAVQLVVPIVAPGLVGTFLCNCTDCRKITASMFATNFTARDSHIRYVRGEENITRWGQDETTSTKGKMTNGFCKTCGTLLYREGSSYPGWKFLRVGTVDDFNLHDTLLKPRVEQFIEHRPNFWRGVEGAKQVEGFAFYDEATKASL